MVLNTSEIMKAVAILADNNDMRITLKQSGKGALICGATCLIGGIVAGPFGLAVGGTMGGIGAWLNTKNSFKPVGDIIRYDLTVEQQEKLRDHIEVAVQQLEMSDVIKLLPLLANSQSVQAHVLSVLASFVQNELHQQLCR